MVEVVQADISEAEKWKGVWGSFAHQLPVEDLAYAFAAHRIAHQRDASDMREAAARVAGTVVFADKPKTIGEASARSEAREVIAAAIRALPIA